MPCLDRNWLILVRFRLSSGNSYYVSARSELMKTFKTMGRNTIQISGGLGHNPHPTQQTRWYNVEPKTVGPMSDQSRQSALPEIFFLIKWCLQISLPVSFIRSSSRIPGGDIMLSNLPTCHTHSPARSVQWFAVQPYWGSLFTSQELLKLSFSIWV